MESSGAKCPDMKSLVENTESPVDCAPLLATSLMDLSGEKSEGGLCTGRWRFVSFEDFSGHRIKLILDLQQAPQGFGVTWEGAPPPKKIFLNKKMQIYRCF